MVKVGNFIPALLGILIPLLTPTIMVIIKSSESWYDLCDDGMDHDDSQARPSWSSSNQVNHGTICVMMGWTMMTREPDHHGHHQIK
jgi:hypothetical protein